MEIFQSKKCELIKQLETTKTLTQLHACMGCIHHLIKFTPNLSSLTEPLSALFLKKNILKSQNKPDRKPLHTEVFQKVKEAIKNITDEKLFDVNFQARVSYGASKKVLVGA